MILEANFKNEYLFFFVSALSSLENEPFCSTFEKHANYCFTTVFGTNFNASDVTFSSPE